MDPKRKRRKGQSFFLAFVGGGGRWRVEGADGWQVRVDFEGATYHVMCRGDRRENILKMIWIGLVSLKLWERARARLGGRFSGFQSIFSPAQANALRAFSCNLVSTVLLKRRC